LTANIYSPVDLAGLQAGIDRMGIPARMRTADEKARARLPAREALAGRIEAQAESSMVPR
jgi:hypothetical protein